MTAQSFREHALAELDAVHRLASHLVRNSHEADDLVQETYLRAFRYASTFTLGPRGIRSWLFKILHNVNYNNGAEHQREQSITDELREMKRIDGDRQSMPVVDTSSLDWDWVDQRLKAAVAELSAPYRIVFLLSAVEGLKYREIADVTEAPLGTVMSRLSRARSILASRLLELGSENGFSREPGLESQDAISGKGYEQTRPQGDSE